MITREELITSPEYWFEEAQNELFRQVTDYMEKEGINQSELANRLGVSKGYISQILNGNFNYTLKKLIEVSLAIGSIPKIKYKPITQELAEDKSKIYASKHGYISLEINTRQPQTLKIIYHNNSSNAAA